MKNKPDLIEELILNRIENNRVGIKIATANVNGWKEAVVNGEKKIQELQSEIVYLESELQEKRIKKYKNINHLYD